MLPRRRITREAVSGSVEEESCITSLPSELKTLHRYKESGWLEEESSSTISTTVAFTNSDCWLLVSSGLDFRMVRIVLGIGVKSCNEAIVIAQLPKLYFILSILNIKSRATVLMITFLLFRHR